MACFHFDFQSGEKVTRDEEGYELPSLEAARQEAMAAAREILADAIRSSSGDVPERFLITDCDHFMQAIVTFSDLLPASLRS